MAHISKQTRHQYPGETVDRLIEQGDIAGAKAELERLLLEGLDSGPAIKVTPDFWENMRARLHRRAATSNAMNHTHHPEADNRIKSATTLIKLLLENRLPQILPKHTRELLDVLLWKITESKGKYKTRYKSSGALNCSDKSQLRHDHVYPKKKMIDLLLSAKSDEIDGILNEAIGCTVTLAEHVELSKHDDECYGPERYRRAKVSVIDTETGDQAFL